MKKASLNLKGFKVAIIQIFAILLLLLWISGCANQQPPGGGEEDKTPPKVKSVSPKPNTVNYRGNSIVIEFDKYVDRRSFQDAFRISPQYKGDITYDFSGKSVEIKFDKPFYKINSNKTFVVNINSVLTDLHNNQIPSPINFAFATGSKIDMGQVSGKVYNNGGKAIDIFAYHIETESGFDPTKNIGDYLTESSQDGSYNLTNLAPGEYRLLAIQDDDKNLLYSADRENFGVLPFDLSIQDSVSVKNVNFYLKNISPSADSSEDVSKFYKDTLGIVYSSIENDSKLVLPEQSIFIFFNKFKPSRDDLVSSLKVTDENNIPEKIVFNWKNDSLAEVFSANRFAMNKNYVLSFALKTHNDSVYNYKLRFRTVNINSFGEMKGSIVSSYDTTETFPVKIEMTASALKPPVKYSFSVSDTVFLLKGILEADYTLYAYIDKNDKGVYDYGSPFPYQYSAPFFVYPSLINIKGGWTVENVVLKFNKY